MSLNDERSNAAVTALQRCDLLDLRAGAGLPARSVTACNSLARVVERHVRGPDLRVVLGPPGCGKTTRLLELLDVELRRGVDPDRIGFVTFTRAARRQAQQQVGKRLGLR